MMLITQREETAEVLQQAKLKVMEELNRLNWQKVEEMYQKSLDNLYYE